MTNPDISLLFNQYEKIRPVGFMLNFSPACERNQEVILQQLRPLLVAVSTVLELGSFSGQHAIHFTRQLPQLTWLCSDLAENLAALNVNLNNAAVTNCAPAIALDVGNAAQWPQQTFDAIYSANTLHIMPIASVIKLFAHSKAVCHAGTLLIVYGPFKYQGQFTSASNAEFQRWLQQRDRQSGIRDFEQVQQLASAQGFVLQADISMPANNQLLVWKMT